MENILNVKSLAVEIKRFSDSHDQRFYARLDWSQK